MNGKAKVETVTLPLRQDQTDTGTEATNAEFNDTATSPPVTATSQADRVDDDNVEVIPRCRPSTTADFARCGYSEASRIGWADVVSSPPSITRSFVVTVTETSPFEPDRATRFVIQGTVTVPRSVIRAGFVGPDETINLLSLVGLPALIVALRLIASSGRSAAAFPICSPTV